MKEKYLVWAVVAAGAYWLFLKRDAAKVSAPAPTMTLDPINIYGTPALKLPAIDITGFDPT